MKLRKRVFVEMMRESFVSCNVVIAWFCLFGACRDGAGGQKVISKRPGLYGGLWGPDGWGWKALLGDT